MLREVKVYSNKGAMEAQRLINEAINTYENDETEIYYQLLIEQTVNVGSISDTKYTVVIEISDIEEIEI